MDGVCPTMESNSRRSSGYSGDPSAIQPGGCRFIIGGAFRVIYRLAQLVLPEEHKYKMRLLLRRKHELPVPACLNQNKQLLMAAEGHKTAGTGGTSLFYAWFMLDLFFCVYLFANKRLICIELRIFFTLLPTYRS